MINDKLQIELVAAMKSKDTLRVSTVRMLISAIKYEQIAKMQDLTEEEEMAVVVRQAKQRREAIEFYEKAGRAESAEKEKIELKILMEYMPAQLSREDLEKIVQDTITEMGVTSLSDMGKVIGAVNAKVKGQTEGSIIAQLVKEKLSANVTRSSSTRGNLLIHD